MSYCIVSITSTSPVAGLFSRQVGRLQTVKSWSMATPNNGYFTYKRRPRPTWCKVKTSVHSRFITTRRKIGVRVKRGASTRPITCMAAIIRLGRIFHSIMMSERLCSIPLSKTFIPRVQPCGFTILYTWAQSKTWSI